MQARLVFLTLTLYMDMVGFYSGVGVDKIFVQVWDSDMGRFDLSFGDKVHLIPDTLPEDILLRSRFWCGHGELGTSFQM
jgi:hypothetical protein